MDNLHLIVKLMESHKEDSNRRFDSLEKKVAGVEKKVDSLSQWKWTTKGKIAGISLFGAGMLVVVFEYIKQFMK